MGSADRWNAGLGHSMSPVYVCPRSDTRVDAGKPISLQFGHADKTGSGESRARSDSGPGYDKGVLQLLGTFRSSKGLRNFKVRTGRHMHHLLDLRIGDAT